MSISPEQDGGDQLEKKEERKVGENAPLKGQGPYLFSTGSIQMAGHSCNEAKSQRRAESSREFLTQSLKKERGLGSKVRSNEGNAPSRNLGSDFDPAILDAGAHPRAEPRALNGVDDGASRRVADGRARRGVRSRVKVCVRGDGAGVGRASGVRSAVGDVVSAACDVVDEAIGDGCFSEVI